MSGFGMRLKARQLPDAGLFSCHSDVHDVRFRAISPKTCPSASGPKADIRAIPTLRPSRVHLKELRLLQVANANRWRERGANASKTMPKWTKSFDDVFRTFPYEIRVNCLSH
jgi:hypothetical protein